MAKDGAGIARRSSAVSRPSGTPTLSKPSSSTATTKPRVSDRLEEDAQEMEDRLIQLRIKMMEDKQKLEKELPAKFSGSRWRSAQEGIGSVSRYAKDLEERMKKGSRATKTTTKKNGKQIEQASESTMVKKTKKKVKTEDDKPLIMVSLSSVKKWTTSHVLEWLTSLGLDEFHPAFEFHQITGAALLEMQPEEFGTIGIDRLSARNRIWNALEKLKDATATTASQRGAQCAGEIIDSKIKDVAVVPEVSSPNKESGGVHWSQVKPLRDHTTANGHEELPVNLADGDFDEDAGHASFMKALLDWRGGDDTTSAQKEETGDDGMWFNPVMAASTKELGDSCEKGGALLEGDYDEAKEQEAFRLAVLAWRREGADSGVTQLHSRPSTVERIETGSATDQRKSCWQCYRVVRADTLVVDTDTRKAFCGSACQSTFKEEYARLYYTKK